MKAAIILVSVSGDKLTTHIGDVTMKEAPAVKSHVMLEGKLGEQARDLYGTDTFQVTQVTHLIGDKHALRVYVVQ